MRQIILDTETTGLSPEKGHRIIEIGCLEMVNRPLTNNNYHIYINPQRPVDKAAVEVHGITDAYLADKLFFADIAKDFLQYLNGAELIIHNAPFDIGFLNHEFKRLNAHYAPITQYCKVIDTLTLARELHPGQQNSLDALCRRYYVNNSNRDLHGALLDAELLAQVYLLMTGGQTQLFELEAAQKNTAFNHSETDGVSLPIDRIPVIQACDEELELHQAFLKQLKDKGTCHWED